MTERLAYLAGYFDGEGSISVGEHLRVDRNYMDRGLTYSFRQTVLQIQVDGTSESAIRMFHDTFGGSFIQSRRLTVRGLRVWKWSVNGGKAKAVLEALTPYLCVKREQALIALEFPLGEFGKRTTEADRLARKAIAGRIRAARPQPAIIEG